jgi:hypothetical protein
LERYLPCATLNLIKESTDGIISAYDDNKLFMEILKKKFEEIGQKITEGEKNDGKQKRKLDYQVTLNKRGYHIP